MAWDRAAVPAPGGALALALPRSAHGPRTLPNTVLSLQRHIGNRAVRRLLRAPSRGPVFDPGGGYDGVYQPYGQVVTRNFSKAQIEAVKDFRGWLESTYSEATGYSKGSWAREAGSRVANFVEQGAQSRATLYAELQRQIIHADGGPRSSWVAMVEKGTDGSYIFKGNPRPPGGW